VKVVKNHMPTQWEYCILVASRSWEPKNPADKSQGWKDPTVSLHIHSDKGKVEELGGDNYLVTMGELGDDGWELVTIEDTKGVFSNPTEAVKQTSDWTRRSIFFKRLQPDYRFEAQP